MKTVSYLKLLSLGIVMAIAFSACHDDEQAADYNGTWETTINYPTTSGYMSFHRQIVLNNSTYTESFINFYPLPAPPRYIYNLWEGKIIKSGNTLQFKPAKMKAYNFDAETGEILGLISEKVPDTTVPEEAIYTLSWETASYTIANGNLVFTVDWNGDGNDQDETVIYTPVTAE
ncbi:MAG: hypothetical protein ACK5JD_14855 [Mangrovibacterium sp.]